MAPIETRRKRTFQQFRDSQEDAVVLDRQQVQEPVVQPPVGIVRRYLNTACLKAKTWYNWFVGTNDAEEEEEHTIDTTVEGRIEEQNNKRRFVVPGSWPESPSPRRQSPRGHSPHPIEPASPSPAPRQRPEPAAIEMQPPVEVAGDLETTSEALTSVTAVEGPRPGPEAVVTEMETTPMRQPRRKTGRVNYRASLGGHLAVLSPQIPKKSRQEGKPVVVGILRKHLVRRTMQQQLQQEQHQQQQQHPKAVRRVHFGEENQILQYCKPFPTKIKEYDIGGICGELPSPLNRKEFQDMRSDNATASPARSDISTPDRRPYKPADLSPAPKKNIFNTRTNDTKNDYASKKNEHNDIKHENDTHAYEINDANDTTMTSHDEHKMNAHEKNNDTQKDDTQAYENKSSNDQKNDTQGYEKTSNDQKNDTQAYEIDDTKDTTMTKHDQDKMNAHEKHNDTHDQNKMKVHEQSNNTHNNDEQTREGERSKENTVKSYIEMLKHQNSQEVKPPVTPTTRRIDELVDQYELFGLSARTRKSRQEKREAARKKAEEEAAAKRKRIEDERRRVLEEKRRLEAERIKKEAEERKKRSIVTELTDEWKTKLADVMSTKNMQKDVAPNLTRKDFGTLLPQSRMDGIGWLNDEIVNGYLTAIVAKALEKQKYDKKAAEEVPQYHAFNTNLYNNMTKKGYESVKRWPVRAKIGGKRFLSVRRCFIPINNHSHWTLICISGTKRTIEYYDSLYNNPEQYTAFALEFVKNVLGDAFIAEEWTIVDASSSQQANGVDCGVFVCINALALALERDPTTAFHARDAAAARQLIGAVLLNGGLSGDFDIEMS